MGLTFCLSRGLEVQVTVGFGTTLSSMHGKWLVDATVTQALTLRSCEWMWTLAGFFFEISVSSEQPQQPIFGVFRMHRRIVFLTNVDCGLGNRNFRRHRIHLVRSATIAQILKGHTPPVSLPTCRARRSVVSRGGLLGIDVHRQRPIRQRYNSVSRTWGAVWVER